MSAINYAQLSSDDSDDQQVPEADAGACESGESAGHQFTFVVNAAAARLIAEIVVQDAYVIARWNIILFDFLPAPSEQERANALLREHHYEQAVLYTLSCWKGRSGETATFEACVAIFETRRCRSLVTDLLENVETIQNAATGTAILNARDPSQSRPVTRATHTQGEQHSSVFVSSPNKWTRKCKLWMLILTLLLLGTGTFLGVAVPLWSKSPPDEPISKSDTIILAGSPGHYIRWTNSTAAELESGLGILPTEVKHLHLSYVHLGPDPNEFLGSIRHWTGLRSARLAHVMWDGSFTNKILLLDLVSFELVQDFESVNDFEGNGTENQSPYPPECSDALVQHLNSLVFFYKDVKLKEAPLEEAAQALRSDISITSQPISLLRPSSDSMQEHRTWFKLKYTDISIDGLPGSFLKKVTKSCSQGALEFTGCSVNPRRLESKDSDSDFKYLSDFYSVALQNVTTVQGNLSEAFRCMEMLASLHFDNPSQVLDIMDINSSYLKQLTVFRSNITFRTERNPKHWSSSCRPTHNSQPPRFLHFHDVPHVEPSDIDLLATTLLKLFPHAEVFIVTASSSALSTLSTQTILNEAIEKMAISKTSRSGGQKLAAMKLAVTEGHLQTYSCSAREYCPVTSCPPSTKYTSYFEDDGREARVYKVCATCVGLSLETDCDSELINYKHLLQETVNTYYNLTYEDEYGERFDQTKLQSRLTMNGVLYKFVSQT